MKRNKNDDICDVNQIYNGSYEYFLPRKTLEEWLNGKDLYHPYKYSPQEKKNLQEDIRGIYQKMILEQSKDNSPAKPVAIITAGASGAGKSTLIKQDLENIYVYVSGSDVCLKNQIRTYQNDLQSSDQSLFSRQNIYSKWKPSARAAKHLILGNMIRDKKSFCLGSTCTDSTTGHFFEFLKKQGYQIKLIYVAASDETRWNSIQERNKTFAQRRRSKQSIKKSSLFLAENIHIFLTYADEITFFYRKNAHEKANLAACWTRNKTPSEALGTLQIFSPIAYTEVKKIHNTATKTLKRPDLDWKTSLEIRSKSLKPPSITHKTKLKRINI